MLLVSFITANWGSSLLTKSVMFGEGTLPNKHYSYIIIDITNGNTVSFYKNQKLYCIFLQRL